ncbi:unnamed protein product [Lymnaea stagnalis]|uniref:Guanylate cyclase n=1 Tax=Lymnaea stagnalis TaxID=6523 RepID=A0AAV2I1Q5_LYMST
MKTPRNERARLVTRAIISVYLATFSLITLADITTSTANTSLTDILTGTNASANAALAGITTATANLSLADITTATTNASFADITTATNTTADATAVADIATTTAHVAKNNKKPNNNAPLQELQTLGHCFDGVNGSVYDSFDKIPPANMTPLTVRVALITNLVKRGHGRLFAGAFFLAVDKLNEIANETGIPVRFNWTVKDVVNVGSTATQVMAHMSCANNVSAFIGPDQLCYPPALVATAFGKPYITFDCRDKLTDPTRLLFVNTETLISFVASSIISLLQHYKWNSFWLITGNTIKWSGTAEHLKEVAEKANITLNGVDELEINDNFSPYQAVDGYLKVIRQSRDKTRVYVFLGEHDSLVDFLRDLAELKLTQTGQYVVIAARDTDHNQTDRTFYYCKFQTFSLLKQKKQPQGYDEYSLEAFKNVLMIAPKNLDIDKKDFENKVYARNLQPPINLRPYPKHLTPFTLPSQAYQLYDATMFYGRAVMALMERPGTDPQDGMQIVSYLRCRDHESIQGDRVYIRSNGESESNYVVWSLKSEDGELDGYLWRVGEFIKVGEEIPKFTPENEVAWVLGQPPLSEPECGFENEHCPYADASDWILAISVSAVACFILIVIVIFILGLRHYMYEKKLDRLAWKIERDDIQILNHGQFREMMTPARPRKKDSFSGGNQLRYFLIRHDSESNISQQGLGSEYIPIGLYRGTYVAIKKLTRKQMELTRTLKKQMQLRKELTHDNVNRFIGACFEPPQIYIVTQYCPRKSLQDILQDDNAPLDDMFITSLVQDLIRGMCFIHDSAFGYHGNLKSSNCLVDSRWTLKISDFGFSVLGPAPRAKYQDEDSFKVLLWTAPELLRHRRSSSSTSGHHPNLHHLNSTSSNTSSSNNNNHNNHIFGNQKGDIYSFSIIMYELYGRAGPWGRVQMTPKEIVEKLIVSTENFFRPDTSELSCDENIISLIQACWDCDPDQRPDFKYGVRTRFKPIQQDYLKSNIFDNMLAMMEKYANNLEAVVAERTEQLRQEKRMTENLLLRMLPRSVAEKLKRGHPVEPEQYEQVSIYFSDIVGFTQLSASSTPMEVVDLLNDLYTCFDSIIEEFDVYKVETIGDAYMVVSGLPIRNGDRHAGEIASMALLLLEAIKLKRFKIQGNFVPNYMLQIRIGIHSGPCCAGVVGLKMPRYCLFGDTVNTANRMESTGEAQRIHCSAECKKILDKLGGYHLEERGYTEMKGKGRLLTYFLQSEDQNHRYRRITRYRKMGNDGRCVSTSNLDYSGKIYTMAGKGNPRIYSSRYPMINRDSNGMDRTSWNSSLNTSMDSTWSEAPDEMTSVYPSSPCLNPPIQATSPHDYVAFTLPRACAPKYNVQMSPIAEDPQSHSDTSTLEKTVSFPDSSLHEVQSLETDNLLMNKLLANSLPDYIPKNLYNERSNGRSNSLNLGLINFFTGGTSIPDSDFIAMKDLGVISETIPEI